jgi:hypothetical protein
MPTPSIKSHGIRVLPDFVAFAFGLALAYGLDWQTTDLVWSLWLSSLVIGYLSLLTGIAAPMLAMLQVLRTPEASGKQRLLILLASAGVALFSLGFFSLHFGAFHVGHAFFLNFFFPLGYLPADAFDSAFANPPLLILLVCRYLIKPYALFLIPIIIAERHHLFAPLVSAVKNLCLADNAKAADKKSADKTPSLKGAFMERPYLNVFRMHILIIFLGFAHALKLDGSWLYTAVYTAYFFPWQELKSIRSQQRSAKGSAKG